MIRSNKKNRERKWKAYRTVIAIIGLILIVSSTLYAVVNLRTAGNGPELDESAEYRMFEAAKGSELLARNGSPTDGCFDDGKLMSVQGDVLKRELEGLDPEFNELEFVIEVIDISGYPVHYNRSIDEDTAIASTLMPSNESALEFTTFETAVNIYITGDEIHTARFIMKIWSDQKQTAFGQR